MIGKMVAAMKTNMPGVTAWHQRMMREADTVGEVRSAILGRRRCFPLKQFELSEVVNFPVQSTGADIINLGLMDIMPRLPEDTFPILQIHDAVVFECAEDDAELVKQLVITSFTRDVTYEGVTVHFPVDARAGKSWAEVN
jgi:DNA polymerase I-like protein with 3'-5' exonuclease and polymerase domains